VAGASDRSQEPDGDVRLLLVIGPGSSLGHSEGIPPPGETVLHALAARLTRVDARTEQETLDALRQPCEAIVLDPGALEHYSTRVADAVRRHEAPTIVVRDRQESRLGPMGAKLAVTPSAGASVSGGGDAACDCAIEAAATFAWERRREHDRDDER
jgi:3-dehydroquinate dehydratase